MLHLLLIAYAARLAQCRLDVPACRLFASSCPLSAWRPSAAGAEGDLQLAWENLETAKVIWAKHADAHAQQLAGGWGSSSGGRDGCR